MNHPQKDFYGTELDNNDHYYILPDETIVYVHNLDEYFVHVLDAQLFKKGEEE